MVRNARPILMIIVSLIAGLSATVIAMRWVNQQTSIPTGRVAVAAADLLPGQPLGQHQVQLVAWPVGNVPAGAFTNLEGLDGRVVRAHMQRDEPILESRLAPVGTKGGLSAVIAEGKRAITVRVNDVVGVAGFALPGNYVDVIVHLRDRRKGGDGDDVVSKIVLEKMLVLAIAQEASRDDTKPKVVNAVTLEASPEQAETLDLARSVGTLSLVLRNQVDLEPAMTAGATRERLLATPKVATSPPAQAPARPVRRVAVAADAPSRRLTCMDTWTGAARQQECFCAGGTCR
jgi:pilus assembly protein CpaB